MARAVDCGPPYNFTDRIPVGQRRDRNGWYFRPEPRSFTIVASYRGFLYITQNNVARDCTLWLYDYVLAIGSPETIARLYDKFTDPTVIDTKGD